MKPVSKYETDDGKIFDTVEEAQAHEQLNLVGSMANAFIASLDLKKGQPMLKERLLAWEAFKLNANDTDTKTIAGEDEDNG